MLLVDTCMPTKVFCRLDVAMMAVFDFSKKHWRPKPKVGVQFLERGQGAIKLGGLGECCKLPSPQWGLGQSPGCRELLGHF